MKLFLFDRFNFGFKIMLLAGWCLRRKTAGRSLKLPDLSCSILDTGYRLTGMDEVLYMLAEA